MLWSSNVHNWQKPTWSGQVGSALVLDLSATDTSWHFSPTEKIMLRTINKEYYSTENLLTAHYNTETGKIYIARKSWNMKVLGVITLSDVHFYPPPPIFSTKKKKIMSMPVRWKVEYEDVTTLYVKGSAQAAQTTLVSTNLYLPYNHLYPLQDKIGSYNYIDLFPALVLNQTHPTCSAGLSLSPDSKSEAVVVVPA